MKQNLLLFISFALIISLLAGCGEKEDKDILEAREALASRDYSAVQTALSRKSDHPEAQSLQHLLQLRTPSGWKTEATTWETAIQKVLRGLQPLNTEIQALESHEDPDSDDLERLERLIRSRNSIMGFLAIALTEAAKRDVELPSNLVDQPESAVITALLEAEKCFNSVPRGAAAMLIHSFGNTSSVSNLLIQETRNTDAEIRRQAVRHLGDLKAPEFIPVFESILKNKDESPDVLYNVITALEQLKSQPIRPALRLATRTNAARARMHAAKLLGQLKAEDSITDLLLLLADSDNYVKNSAINALIQIGEPSIKPLIEVIDSDTRNILPDENPEFKAEYGYIAHVYIDATRERNHRISTQAAVIQTLGGLKAKEAISRLIDLFEDDDLRDEAAAALTVMKGAAVPDLLRALQDARDDVRIHTAEVLNNIADARSIDALAEALNNDPAKEVKAAAAKALGTVKLPGKNNSAINPLVHALDLDDTIAANAATALGAIKISTPQGIEKLIAMALNKRGRETVRSAALSALTQLKPPKAVQPMMLLVFSDETSPVLRREAVTALGEIKAKESISVLLWVLSTRYEDVKDFQRHMKRRYNTLAGLRKAIEALGIQWTGEYPKPTYRTWAELKPMPSLVRSEAAISLGKIKGELLFTSAGLAKYAPDLNAGNMPPDLQQEFKNNEIPLSKDVKIMVDRLSEIWFVTDTDNKQKYHLRKVVNLNVYAKGDEVLETLFRALKDDERAAVRRGAAIALQEIKGELVIPHLVRALKEDKQGVARQEAAVSLGKITGDNVVQPLLTALKKDKYETTRKQAAIALRDLKQQLADRGLVDVLEKGVGPFEEDHEAESIMTEVIASLNKDGNEATVGFLLDALKSTDQDEVWLRWALLHTIGVVKGTSDKVKMTAAQQQSMMQAIRNELENPNYLVRKEAVAALGKSKDREVFEVLIQVLQDTNEYKSIRATAAAGLGTLLDERVSAPLLAALDDENAEVRLQAATALGPLKAANTVDKLIELIENPLEDPSVQAACVTALGLIGDKRAEAVLLNVLKTETGDIPDGITLNTEDSETVSGPPYIPIYIPIYGNAIMALGKLKSTAAVDELIKILEDQSLEMDHATDVTVKLSFRIKAADALAEIEDARAAEALGRRLVDESEYVVTAKDDLNRKGAWAWEALVNAAKPFQLPAFAASGLIERINQSAPEDWPIKAAATIALGGCNTAEVVPKLRELLTDPKKEVRQAAALGAGKPWHSELRDDLVKIMKGETEADIDVRRGATQGVGGLAHPSTVPHLAEVFNNDINPEEIRRDAALALGKIGNDAAVSPLIEKLKALPSDQATKNFRLDIIKGLAEAKNQKAVSVLETAMDDQDTEIHFWAADALFQITGNEYGYHRAR